jgi:hypothetical protein
MAKGQKRSGKEPRKPKQAIPAAAMPSRASMANVFKKA